MLAKPTAKNWEKFLSGEAHSRKASSIKTLEQYVGDPNKIFLGSGQPSAEHFPIDELELTLSKSAICKENDASRKLTNTNGESEYRLVVALQYGQGQGSPHLLRWVREHTNIVHRPMYTDWNCVMSAGSTSALEMTFRMLCKAGHWILCEEFTYPIVLEMARPLGLQFAGVRVDEHGIIPQCLDQVITDWDTEARHSPRPSILYTIPTGQNPTGSTQPLFRRREIYAVAQKHDILVIEDDPYYFLQTCEENTDERQNGSIDDEPGVASLKNLVQSYLSIDIDGRVIRLDSFSKLVAPGCRVGWITASEQICECYRLHADMSTQGPSGLSQIVLYRLLNDYWGHKGYLERLERLRRAYEERRSIAVAAATKFIARDYAAVTRPKAGLFLWVEVNIKKHPRFSETSNGSIEHEINERVLRHGVVVVKGSFFYAEPRQNEHVIFFRLTYAVATFEAIEQGLRRFGEALSESFACERTNSANI